MGVFQEGMRDGVKQIITLFVVLIFIAILITILILAIRQYFDAKSFIKWLLF